MANINAPFGALPVSNSDGSSWNGRTSLFYIPSSDGSAYYIGDFVKSAANADANGIPAIQKAVAGDTVRGSLVGVYPVAPNGVSLVGNALSLETLTIPATKTQAYYVAIAETPDLTFEIQGDTTGTNQVAANANKNANFTVATPSSGNFSATVINSSTIATTSTLPLKLMGLAQRSTNAFGASAVWRVRINQHELMGNTAGI